MYVSLSLYVYIYIYMHMYIRETICIYLSLSIYIYIYIYITIPVGVCGTRYMYAHAACVRALTSITLLGVCITINFGVGTNSPPLITSTD